MFGSLLTAALVMAMPQVELKTLGGQQSTGTLLRWNAQELVIQDGQGEHVEPVGRLLTVRVKLDAASPTAVEAQPAAGAPGAGAWVELVDGSRLTGVDCTVAKRRLRLQLDAKQTWELPTSSVATVRLKPPGGPLAGQWDEVRRAKVAGDVLVIRKKDALDYVEGVLGDVTADSAQFKFDGEEVSVKRDRVEGWIYFHAGAPQLAELVCVVRLAGGARLQASQVRLQEGKLHVVTLAGAELTLPLDDLVEVDYSAGKIQYLSDLEPESVKWTPYFGLPKEVASLSAAGLPARDRSLEGGPLTLAHQEKPGRWEKVTYRKGIALRSRTELSYRLPGGFRRLTAVAGIDDRVREGGHVRLLLRGDGKTLLETVVAGRDEPLPIDLDVTGVRRLQILVDYGNDLDIADHLDLCDARISK